MNFFFIHPFKLRKDPADAHRTQLHDQSEGSEFLDDVLYREDREEIPVSYAVENNSTDAPPPSV